MTQAARAHIRLAELLGVLSFGADLGMGQPMEHVLRQCLISLRLAERMGLDEADREVVYYTSLLAWVGCHIDAYEQAKWFGDDTALKTDFRHTDFGPAAARPLFILRHLGAGRPLAERARLGVTFPGDGRRVAEAMIENHWLAADGLGERLGMPQRVRDSVEQTFERWDGKGVPKGARGEQILLTSRLVALADVVEVFHRAGGAEAAVAVARQRRGTQFDPQVVDVFTGQAASVLAGLDEAGSWDAVISAEPARGRRLTGPEFDTALEAIADFTDVKSPYTIGHSRGVADLAGKPRASSAWATRPPRRSAGPDWCMTWGGSACRTPSGTSPGRSATRKPSAFGFILTSPSGCWRARPRSPRWPPWPCSTTSGWTARDTRAGCPAAR